MRSRLAPILVLTLVVGGCTRGPGASVSPHSVNCVQSQCTVTFSVTSDLGKSQSVSYEIELYQQYPIDSHNWESKSVGSSRGKLELQSHETTLVEVVVGVEEEPNLSEISVRASRGYTTIGWDI